MHVIYIAPRHFEERIEDYFEESLLDKPKNTLQKLVTFLSNCSCSIVRFYYTSHRCSRVCCDVRSQNEDLIILNSYVYKRTIKIANQQHPWKSSSPPHIHGRVHHLFAIIFSRKLWMNTAVTLQINLVNPEPGSLGFSPSKEGRWLKARLR